MVEVKEEMSGVPVVSFVEGKPYVVVLEKQYMIEIPPGRVLVLNTAEEQRTAANIILPGSIQDEHGRKLGIHFPLAVILAVGVVDPTVAGDADRAVLWKLEDVVWYDYRQSGHIICAGREYYIVPRSAIVGRVHTLVAKAAPPNEVPPQPPELVVPPTPTLITP